MTEELRTTLHRIADEAAPVPVADDLWRRGRAARRRGQAFAVAAVLALLVSVGGIATLTATTDREARTASTEEVEGGAIPSVIPEPEGDVVTDLAIGGASVAYVDSGGMPVLVDASTGEAHAVELPDFPEPETLDLTADHRRGPVLALSPDGRRVAYPTTTRMEREPGEFTFITSWYRVVDLGTGESDLVEMPPRAATPLAMSWTTDGHIAVDVYGRATRKTSAINPPDAIRWIIDPTTGDSSTSPLTGVVAPGGGISATYPETADRVRAVPFQTSTGTDPARELPADLYPGGASVTPVGWADNSLLVAGVDAPDGSYVEGLHLVLMTSPDRPESEWTFRILVRDLPDTPSLSVAVDLIPDLDGTSTQDLTHDFDGESGDDEGRGPLPYVLGGLMALLAGLAYIRMLHKQA